MKALTDILSQADLDSMRLPLEYASPPPASITPRRTSTNSRKIRIFLKEWLWVGHAADVRNPGDITFEIAEEPVVVVRDRNNQLHAFSSVCRHREPWLPAAKETAGPSPAHITIGSMRSTARNRRADDERSGWLRRLAARVSAAQG